eukprot:2557176-Rhodomonas_salina.2
MNLLLPISVIDLVHFFFSIIQPWRRVWSWRHVEKLSTQLEVSWSSQRLSKDVCHHVTCCTRHKPDCPVSNSSVKVPIEDVNVPCAILTDGVVLEGDAAFVVLVQDGQLLLLEAQVQKELSEIHSVLSSLGASHVLCLRQRQCNHLLLLRLCADRAAADFEDISKDSLRSDHVHFARILTESTQLANSESNVLTRHVSQ